MFVLRANDESRGRLHKNNNKIHFEVVLISRENIDLKKLFQERTQVKAFVNR
jgi:hypothetical protein